MLKVSLASHPRLRTFQLSKTFLPVEMPTPVQALGRSLPVGLGDMKLDGLMLDPETRTISSRWCSFGDSDQRLLWKRDGHSARSSCCRFNV